MSTGLSNHELGTESSPFWEESEIQPFMCWCPDQSRALTASSSSDRTVVQRSDDQPTQRTIERSRARRALNLSSDNPLALHTNAPRSNPYTNNATTDKRLEFVRLAAAHNAIHITAQRLNAGNALLSQREAEPRHSAASCIEPLTTRPPRPRRSPPARPRTPRPPQWRPGTAGTRSPGRSCWTLPL